MISLDFRFRFLGHVRVFFGVREQRLQAKLPRDWYQKRENNGAFVLTPSIVVVI